MEEGNFLSLALFIVIWFGIIIIGLGRDKADNG